MIELIGWSMIMAGYFCLLLVVMIIAIAVFEDML